MKLNAWFQGPATCDGLYFSRGYFGPRSDCLWTYVARTYKLPEMPMRHPDFAQLAIIIKRLFPEKACRCPHVSDDTSESLIHFNNRHDVTRGMVEKVLHTFEMERDTKKAKT